MVNRDATFPCLFRVGDFHPALKPGETGDAPLECHDLTINNEIAVGLFSISIDQLGIGIVKQLFVAREQTHAFPRPKDEHALAVEFSLQIQSGAENRSSVN